MYHFYDSAEDMAQHIKRAEENIMPLIDLLEGGGVKYRTALFVVFTRRAIRNDGLRRDYAHKIVDTMFDSILAEGMNSNDTAIARSHSDGG